MIAAGAPANLTLTDPSARWTVRPERMVSTSRNTPYAGRELPGRVVATFLHGRATVLDGEPVHRDAVRDAGLGDDGQDAA
jgi:dihydroorotase